MHAEDDALVHTPEQSCVKLYDGKVPRGCEQHKLVQNLHCGADISFESWSEVTPQLSSSFRCGQSLKCHQNVAYLLRSLTM